MYVHSVSLSIHATYVVGKYSQLKNIIRMYSCAVTTYIYICVTITALHRPPTFVYTTTTASHGMQLI